MKVPQILKSCISEYTVSQLSARLTIVLVIPIYEFIIYPFLRRYVLRILRRIGLGMVIALAGTIGMLVIDLVGHGGVRGHCMLFKVNFAAYDPALNFTPGFLIPLIFFISLGEMLMFIPSKTT